MTKDYFKFIKLIENETKDKDDKPSHQETGALRDKVGRNYQAAENDAIQRSKPAGAPNYIVFQNRADPTEFRVVKALEPQNQEEWRVCCDVSNGNVKKVNGLSYEKLIEGALNEKLSVQGRRSLKRAAKRRKSSLKIARRRAKRKVADSKKIAKRAQKRARKAVVKQLTHGKGTKGMGHAGLNRIQAMVNARHGQLDQIRRSLIPQARKDDRKR